MSHEEELLQRAADALGRLPVRGLVTTGPAIDPAVIRAPANVSVRRWVRHADVLPYCSAVLSHGGHGTVIKALAAGVPLVVAPLGRDQPDNAARVVRAGAGLRVSRKAKRRRPAQSARPGPGRAAIPDGGPADGRHPGRRTRRGSRRRRTRTRSPRTPSRVTLGPPRSVMPVKEEMDMTKIAVAGATGRVGRHIVDVLHGGGHDVVPISRSNGVDVITGDGLAAALEGVEVVIDVTTGPSPEQGPATEFFTTATRNLQEAGVKAGVRRLVVVSIIGVDKSAGGYGAAKMAHERAALAGPIPARILRAAQFHELVEMLMGWGRQGDVIYLPKMRTQIVAARTVAGELAALALSRTSRRARSPRRSPARARNTSPTWPS